MSDSLEPLVELVRRSRDVECYLEGIHETLGEMLTSSKRIEDRLEVLIDTVRNISTQLIDLRPPYDERLPQDRPGLILASSHRIEALLERIAAPVRLSPLIEDDLSPAPPPPADDDVTPSAAASPQ